MLKAILVLATLTASVAVLSACSGGRYAGPNTCAADGSVVVYEYPNVDGSYDTLNTHPCNPQ